VPHDRAVDAYELIAKIAGDAKYKHCWSNGLRAAM
jgi:hypothetical protein